MSVIKTAGTQTPRQNAELKPLYCKVALDVPTVSLDRLYTYQVPAEIQGEIAAGSKVIAPFGKQMLEGYVLELIAEPDLSPSKIKPLRELIPGHELIPEFLALTEWMKSRYLTSYISILKGITPVEGKEKRVARVRLQLKGTHLQEQLDRMSARSFKQKQVLYWMMEQEGAVLLLDLLAATGAQRTTVQALVKQGILDIRYEEMFRSPLSFDPEEPSEVKQVVLTDEQEHAVSAIRANLDQGLSGQFLLQGVTGSGKTEVYLQAIAHALALGKSSIVLVPEIALTPQLINRFQARFGNQIAVLHSKMADGERFDEWRRIRQGLAKVVIGARSAVFAPIDSIGLLILDEEHESTYKQEDHPKYHTREIALFRAKYHSGVVVYGSATPSLETRFAAERGRINHLVLTKRASGISMPQVQIVDMCKIQQEGVSVLFSPEMKRELGLRLKAGEQSILFLNRRGYASSLLCRKCGYVPTCENCAVSLTYHHAYRPKALCCHYCGYATEATSRCPNCASDHMKQFGVGTERAELELKQLFPQARILRMDVDTTRTKGSLEQLLQAFRHREADILLGTQMIAKGHDFPHVSFVGILSADTSLHLPDVRAAERTFQLLTQVAGRAGRHQIPGKVILQTYHPDHYAVMLASKQNYEAFYAQELAVREAMKNPPFWEISIVTVTHDRMKEAASAAKRIGSILQKQLANVPDAIVHDPVPAPIERLHGKDRVHITLRYKRFRDIQAALSEWHASSMQIAQEYGAYLSLDINAQWVV